MAARRNEVDGTLDNTVTTVGLRSVRKTFLKTFLILFLLIVAFMALFVIGSGVFDVASKPQAISSIHSLIVSATPWLILWRAGLFLALVVFWPVWAQLLAQRCNLSTHQTTALLAARWKVAAWLVVIELVIVQALPVKFIHAIANW
jgi:hypothetical protein